MSEPLDSFPDDGRDLRRSDDLRGENSKLTLAFDSGAEFGVFVLKSLAAPSGRVVAGEPEPGAP